MSVTDWRRIMPLGDRGGGRSFRSFGRSVGSRDGGGALTICGGGAPFIGPGTMLGAFARKSVRS